MKNNKNTIDMINGPLMKNIWLFALPLMATTLLQMLFNAADTIVCGKFAGQQALAAVGSTGSLIFLMTGLFNGLSTGTNVVIANAIGTGDESKISKAVHTSVMLGLCCGAFLSLFGMITCKFLLQLISTPADIIDLSTLYMRIYFFGSIFMLTYNFGSAALRAKGDTKRPMYFLTISGILNVVLNLIFVIVLKLHVIGVAVATVASQALSCICVLYCLTKDQDATHLDFKKLKFDGRTVREILRIGLPAGIGGCAFSISNVVVQSSINSFNSSVIVAGNSAGGNIESFVYIGMMAFSQACLTFTSQNIGAKRYDKVKKIMNLTLVLNFTAGFAVGLTALIFSRFFLSFYTNSPEVIEVGVLRIKYVAFLLVFNGVMDIFISSIRGMGESTLPTVLQLIGVCGVRLTWLLIIFPMHRTMTTIYLCFPISWITTSILLYILWVRKYKSLMKSVQQ